MKASTLFSLSPSIVPTTAGDARMAIFWRVLGVIIFALLLAKWTWVFIAPKDAALPTTAAWKKGNEVEHLFGDAPAEDTAQASNLGNIQLVGVFAHPTAGFAVLSVDGKQVGVGLGESVMTGTRLVDTKADYVMLERGGVRSRITLAAGKSISGITPAGSAQNTDQRGNDAVSQLNQFTQQQRTAMQKELNHFGRRP